MAQAPPAGQRPEDQDLGHDASLVGVIAPQAGGKTTLLGRLIGSGLEQGGHFRIYDQYSSFGGKLYASVDAFVAEARARNAAEPLAVFRPSVPGASLIGEQLFNAVAALVDSSGGTLVVDEVREVIDPRKRYVEPPTVARVSLRGRRIPRAGLVWAAHRATHVHIDLRTATMNAGTIYVGRQNDPDDVDYFRHSLGPWGKWVASILPRLPNLYFVELTKGALVQPRVRQIIPVASDFASRALG